VSRALDVDVALTHHASEASGSWARRRWTHTTSAVGRGVDGHTPRQRTWWQEERSFRAEILHVQDLLALGLCFESDAGCQRVSIELGLAQLGRVRTRATSCGRGCRIQQQREASQCADEPEGVLQAVACVCRTRTRSNPLEMRRTKARLVSTGVVCRARWARVHGRWRGVHAHWGVLKAALRAREVSCVRAGALTARSLKSGKGRGGGWPALFHCGASSEVVCPPRRACMGSTCGGGQRVARTTIRMHPWWVQSSANIDALSIDSGWASRVRAASQAYGRDHGCARDSSAGASALSERACGEMRGRWRERRHGGSVC
jgi:hypothetical protein